MTATLGGFAGGRLPPAAVCCPVRGNTCGGAPFGLKRRHLMKALVPQKPSLLKLQHDYVPKSKRELVSTYDLAKVGFFLFGFPKNGFGSVDVSKECNLRCRHCYFFEQEYEGELSVTQWMEKL